MANEFSYPRQLDWLLMKLIFQNKERNNEYVYFSKLINDVQEKLQISVGKVHLATSTTLVNLHNS